MAAAGLTRSRLSVSGYDPIRSPAEFTRRRRHTIPDDSANFSLRIPRPQTHKSRSSLRAALCRLFRRGRRKHFGSAAGFRFRLGLRSLLDFLLAFVLVSHGCKCDTTQWSVKRTAVSEPRSRGSSLAGRPIPGSFSFWSQGWETTAPVIAWVPDSPHAPAGHNSRSH